MSRTGEQMLTALSEMVNDYFASTTTSAGNSTGTTLIDTALKNHGDDRLAGRFVRLATAPFATSRATANVQSSGVLTVGAAFSAQVNTSVAYQLHRYEPSKKFRALDDARLLCMESVYKVILDDTITGDGKSMVFDLPSSVEQGPHIAYFEHPQAPDVEWNFITDPHLDSTSAWTSSNVTASLFEVDPSDLVLPKFTDRDCTKLVVAGATAATYRQVVGSMRNDVTATKAAGRRMTFAAWVYCLAASRVTLSILTDAGTLATGTAHQGKGWELIYVEGDVAGNNATTLTVSLNVSNSAAPITAYAQRAWFYYGSKERVTDNIFQMEHPVRARADDTTKQIFFDEVPGRGVQVRIQGKAPVSALGTDATTQSTNTMEVDEKSAKILVAKAAELMLIGNAIISDSQDAVRERIAAVLANEPEYKRQWAHKSPTPRMKNPFAS